MQRISYLLVLLLFFTAFDADAQRRATYESLLQRSDRPAAYIDHIMLPETDSTATLAVFFRLDYNFIPFLRKRADVTPPTPESEYFASVRMGLEVFGGLMPQSRRSRGNPVSVFRDSWRDTIWVSSFEETTSRFDHVQGFLSTELKKGDYHYSLQLQRAESVRESASQNRNVTVPQYSKWEKAGLYPVNIIDISTNQLIANILNYGDNVLYGQDYDLLITLPSGKNPAHENLKLSIYKIIPGGGAETEDTPRLEIEIPGEQIFRVSESSLNQTDDGIQLTLETGSGDFTFAYAAIPNHKLENARYKLILTAGEESEPLAERTIATQWIDMPVSLYNLDVAIDQLRFIVNDEELRRINSGSAAERERKFREFWAQRDPEPELEFNPLMTEYYRRIDYSYRNFSSLQTPGYDSDQGKAYILYGPPLNVERRLLTNRPTREIWEYPGRTLIFEATSGFGDFRLVSES